MCTANHKLATAPDTRGLVDREMKSQINQGHYVIASEKPAIISPLAAIPKDGGTAIRLIHDGSRPEGEAMNDYTEHHSVRYQTIQDACRMAKRGYYCAKLDIQSAYRSVCIHPDDYKATGLAWKFDGDDAETYLFDTRLPFGSKCGPSHFSRLSNAIRRIAVRHGYEGIVCYIDDFFLAFDTYEKCNEALHYLLGLLRRLGFNVSWKKEVGPAQRVTFLSVDIDTRDCSMSLGAEKLAALHEKLSRFKCRARATKRQLQSLAGSLNWACQVVRGGRFFLLRILDTIQHLRHARHKAKLGIDFKKDLSWWLTFLSTCNGRFYFRDASEVHVHVDACVKACGMFCEGDWRYSVFTEDWPAVAPLHINYKEVCSVVAAVRHWAPGWAGRTVVVHTDSTVTKAIINKGRCKNQYINDLLRGMCWQTIVFNFEIRAIHVPGLLNSLPDTISRLHQTGNIEKLGQLLTY